MFRKEHIRRAPVMKNGKLLGIVSQSDLLNASPSSATTLSVWELNYLVSKVTVKDVMTRSPITIDPDAPLGTAMATMRHREVRHLPVVDEQGGLVGMITDRDLRDAAFSPPWRSTSRAAPSGGCAGLRSRWMTCACATR